MNVQLDVVIFAQTTSKFGSYVLEKPFSTKWLSHEKMYRLVLRSHYIALIQNKRYLMTLNM